MKGQILADLFDSGFPAPIPNTNQEIRQDFIDNSAFLIPD